MKPVSRRPGARLRRDAPGAPGCTGGARCAHFRRWHRASRRRRSRTGHRAPDCGGRSSSAACSRAGERECLRPRPVHDKPGRLTDLDAHGRQTVCHLDVGVSDTRLPDASRLPTPCSARTAGDGRRWLDIRDVGQRSPVLTDRIALCRGKGFDAIDADTATVTRTPAASLSRRRPGHVRPAGRGIGASVGLAVTVRTLPGARRPDRAVRRLHRRRRVLPPPDCGNYFVYIDAGKAVFDVETVPDGVLPAGAGVRVRRDPSASPSTRTCSLRLLTRRRATP